MDTRLLDILACPVCKGELIYQKSGEELVCKPCRLAFPVRDGIPMLLEEEARTLTPEAASRNGGSGASAPSAAAP
ncbi:MAG: Trm112 family protein [Zoogloeaceae bacterium]|jgi:uncharacterized protein YbaR (Trm112 family)|nr:Trm112 family protein [Zoogloeaceae bacterium]